MCSKSPFLLHSTIITAAKWPNIRIFRTIIILSTESIFEIEPSVKLKRKNQIMRISIQMPRTKPIFFCTFILRVLLLLYFLFELRFYLLLNISAKYAWIYTQNELNCRTAERFQWDWGKKKNNTNKSIAQNNYRILFALHLIFVEFGCSQQNWDLMIFWCKYMTAAPHSKRLLNSFTHNTAKKEKKPRQIRQKKSHSNIEHKQKSWQSKQVRFTCSLYFDTSCRFICK